MKKGFSLIELSIVIAIIALIVASISAGGKFIRNARMKQIMAGFDRYEVAVNDFILAYDNLPGDMDNAQTFWPSCADETSNPCNGDGDTFIKYGSPYESLRAWQHMSLAGILPETYIGLLVDGVAESTPGINAPDGALPNSCYDIDSSGLLLNDKGVRLQYGGALSAAACNIGNILPREAKLMDKEIDDGEAMAGLFFSSDSSGSAGSCLSSNQYDLDKTTFPACRVNKMVVKEY